MAELKLRILVVEELKKLFGVDLKKKYKWTPFHKKEDQTQENQRKEDKKRKKETKGKMELFLEK